MVIAIPTDTGGRLAQVPKRLPCAAVTSTDRLAPQLTAPPCLAALRAAKHGYSTIQTTINSWNCALKARKQRFLTTVHTLGTQAARGGFSVLYVRAARLFDELQVAHGDGSFARRLGALARLDLLVIDDFAISPIGAAERNDLLELLDDRIGTRSTLITSQLPVKAWHTYLNDPTLADAILDRVVHSSHKIELKATKSLRETDQAQPA